MSGIFEKLVEKEHVRLPISHPAPAASGKTGSWRTHRPVINKEKCIKCLLCWLYCPEGTIVRLEDNSVEVDYEYCKGCGVCVEECPVKAIEMVIER